MREKTEFKWFTISDWEREEEYLRSMHKAGWKIDTISWPGFYHFKECEPADVVYRLDYNEENTKEKNSEEEYRQLFQDCGWDFVLKFVGYTYFCKPADMKNPKDDEIFGDDQSKLDMCKRVIKGRMLPLLIMFSLVVVPQLITQYISMQKGNHFATVTFVMFLLIFTLYVWIFSSFAYHYLKVKKEHE